MLTSKTFVKKTRRGTVLKIVREHYLRDDIWCSSSACHECQHDDPILDGKAENKSGLLQGHHYLLPDTNVVLHQIDVLEDSNVMNVIVLQTVMDELKHRSAPIYKRLKDCIDSRPKKFYLFVNEFHKDTYVEREPGESANDRNDRAIRQATTWYNKHLKLSTDDIIPQVVLLTNDAGNRDKAHKEGLTVFTVHDYVKSLTGCGELVDRLAAVDAQSLSFARNVFPEHLALSVIQRGLKSGSILQGKFSASRENYLEANVGVPDREEFVFVQGSQNLNRAVDGDIVAIQLLPESEWTCPSNMEMRDEVEKEDNEETGKEDNLVSTKKSRGPKLPSGRVVGIIKRNWRQYCGILQKSLVKEASRHLFVPAERKIPKIRIETRQAELLSSQRIIVAIDSWPRTSRYPQGHFVRKLGNIGDKDTENEVLLLEHDIPHQAFSEAVTACLPSLPWRITDEDVQKRTDLRHVTVCSVDPPGCTDIDDALHCRVLDNGNWECGVHIADVSHFIRPGTAIDREAAKRGTTVYLIDKRIDMVPELLSSNLCSLRGGEERFAFSTIWEMTPDAEIINVKFFKSIILSKGAFTYAEAQMRIDDPTQKDEIACSLRRLLKLSKILKRRRIENGALSLASQEVRFHIDSETHDPIDVKVKQVLETMSMIEEFMLLANVATAAKTLQEFPNCACLRRHPSPPASNYDPICKAAASRGHILNVSNGKELADSLDKAVDPNNPFFNTMLRILATRCMMQAVYFCSGMLEEEDYVHYGLAAKLYTHFTSPIRRYSDIIVHRLLAVAIGADASYPELLDKKQTQNTCNNLNFRHKMAQYAGRASVGLHTQLFFRNRVLDEQAYILFVRKNALQVLIPKFGLEGTVFTGDHKGKTMFTYDEEECTQTCGDTVFHVFDPVTVQIRLDQSDIQHQKLCLNLVLPEIAGFSVPPLKVEDESEDKELPPKKKIKT